MSGTKPADSNPQANQEPGGATRHANVRPSRRGLLGGAAALLGAVGLPGGARAAPSACASRDVELLAACALFWRLDATVSAQNRDCSLADVPFGDPRHDEHWQEIERTGDAWDEAVDGLYDLAATTPEGVRAKAEAARRILLRETCWQMDAGEDDDDNDFADRATRKEWMLLSLLDDLTGRA